MKEVEDKGATFLSMDSVGQKIVEAKEEQGKTDIEDVVLMSNKPHHPVNLIVMKILKEPSESWEENYIAQVVSKEIAVIEVPHIDFIFGDQDT